MSRNSAYAPTVSFLPELAPTLDARRVALETYERQCSPEPGSVMLYTDEQVGVWGFIGPDAVMLFKMPKE